MQGVVCILWESTTIIFRHEFQDNDSYISIKDTSIAREDNYHDNDKLNSGATKCIVY